MTTLLTTLQEASPHPMQHCCNMHPLSMSAIRHTNCTHPSSNPPRRRRGSGELDVFEAARYFSDGVVCVGLLGGIAFQTSMKQREEDEDKRRLEIAMKRSMQAQESTKGKMSPNKSPGGRLASFLSSLFHQKTSKKKSKSIFTTQPKETEDHEVRTRDAFLSHRRVEGIRYVGNDWNGDEEEEEEEEDDGGSSDSSSDLFELKSYDLKNLSSDLPVYGTTKLR
ncbi:uncharacterized protein [Typha latifolia]|uniref:uncharacterized protein n=1 Tax=Typha latifolia TaxID=4733 RepID=UPI003C3010A5